MITAADGCREHERQPAAKKKGDVCTWRLTANVMLVPQVRTVQRLNSGTFRRVLAIPGQPI